MLSLFGPDGPSGNPNVVTVSAHSTADVSRKTALFNGPNTSNQTVLPEVTTLGEYDLDDGFGFEFTWPGLSNRTSYSEDTLNTWGPDEQHKVRVYQLKDSTAPSSPTPTSSRPRMCSPRPTSRMRC